AAHATEWPRVADMAGRPGTGVRTRPGVGRGVHTIRRAGGPDGGGRPGTGRRPLQTCYRKARAPALPGRATAFGGGPLPPRPAGCDNQGGRSPLSIARVRSTRHVPSGDPRRVRL